MLYPSGDRSKDYLSLYLQLADSSESWKKVSVEYSMEMKNQMSDRHHFLKGTSIYMLKHQC